MTENLEALVYSILYATRVGARVTNTEVTIDGRALPEPAVFALRVATNLLGYVAVNTTWPEENDNNKEISEALIAWANVIVQLMGQRNEDCRPFNVTTEPQGIREAVQNAGATGTTGTTAATAATACGCATSDAVRALEGDGGGPVTPRETPV